MGIERYSGTKILGPWGIEGSNPFESIFKIYKLERYRNRWEGRPYKPLVVGSSPTLSTQQKISFLCGDDWVGLGTVISDLRQFPPRFLGVPIPTIEKIMPRGIINWLDDQAHILGVGGSNPLPATHTRFLFILKPPQKMCKNLSYGEVLEDFSTIAHPI